MKQGMLLKMTISLALVLFAVIAAATQKSIYALLILPGMLLGFHGDLCLAKPAFIQKLYKEPFLIGAGSFLVGHFFYIAAFVSAGSIPAGPFWGAFALFAIISAAAWVLTLRKAKGSSVLRVGLLVYALVVGLMASFAFALACGGGGVYWLAAFGGALFVVSDGLIALKDFAGIKIRHAGILIWATYAPAQLLIILVGFFAR